jgi:5,10-methenyltetrahydrofolate synthetase
VTGAPKPGIAAWRTQMRLRIMAARAAVPLAARQRKDQRIERLLESFFPQLAGLTIGLYWPMRVEFDPRSIAQRWRREGALIALPVAPAGAALGYREWHLAIDALDERPEPGGSAEAAAVQPAACLVPALAFDERGFRLGYGGAYFDRTLAQYDPQPLKIGIAHELSRIATIHPLRHDIPMHFIVTERGVHRAEPGGLRLLDDAADAARAVEEILARGREARRGRAGPARRTATAQAVRA